MSNNKDLVTVNNSLVEPNRKYGDYAKRSTLCPICTREDHMEINLARARDHLSINDIALRFAISPSLLQTHFGSHFIISSSSQQILNIMEDDSQEAKEIVSKIFEKNIDLVEGAESVLQSKAQRLLPILNRIKHLTDFQEINELTDEDKQELFLLNKQAGEIEDSILKAYTTIDKKLFPFKKDEINNAVTAYKLSVLSKLLDQIQLVFVEFEKRSPEYAQLIEEMRNTLADKFNQLEDIIVKAGGILKPIDNDSEK